MARMLIHSDNRATDILLKDLGGPHALHELAADNGVTGLHVDRTIAQLLSAKRDLWDRRDSSTPMAMVDLLRRIYKAELIEPESRNYLLDLMAQCETGKNRMKALLPNGVTGRAQDRNPDGLADDVGFITMPDGHRVAVAIFTRGGTDRPRTIAESDARDLRRLQGDGDLAVRHAGLLALAGAAPHRCTREDRPLSGGRAGRSLSEADHLADQGDRAARDGRQRSGAAG